MPKRGRKPKHPALRLLEGHRGHRPIGLAPATSSHLPSPPTWLDREARAEWRRVAPILEKIGGDKVDRAILSAYCATWSEWVAADADVKTQGLTIATPQGVIKNPLVSVRNDALKNMNRMMADLGLTPSARARFAAAPDAARDDLEAWDKAHA